MLEPKEKADLFASTFTKKCMLPPAEVNSYTKLAVSGARELRAVLGVIEEPMKKELAELREDSATGPDGLPTRVLKKCSKALARPVRRLVTLLLGMGVWPSLWMEHWIVPIYARKAVFKLENYR